MVEQEGQKRENIDFSVKFDGNREELIGGLDKALSSVLVARTGLELGNIEFTSARYSVTLKPIKSKDTYQGVSLESIDKAIEDASKNGTLEFDQRNVQATLERTASVPYFLVPVRVRSLYEGEVPRMHADAVAGLKSTYGSRLNPNPDAVEFRVVKTDKNYARNGDFPQGDFKDLHIISQGKNAESMKKAIEMAAVKSNERGKVKSTVYEQTTQMIVYGIPQESLASVSSAKSSRQTIGSAGLATAGATSMAASPRSSYSGSGSSYRRAGSPAGREPSYFASSNSLM